MVAVAAFVVLAGALFIYMLVSTPKTEVATTTPQVASSEDAGPMIVAKHQFRQGVHTIAGTLDLPSACDQISAEPFFPDARSSIVEIRFMTVSATGTCTAAAAPVPFRVTVNAPEHVTWKATWNNAPARLNLVPVGVDESLDGAFDIKG